MREILFRGKPTKRFKDFLILRKEFCSNGYVYGSLVISNKRYYICVSGMCSSRSIINNGVTTMVEVIPETVGQFTGLYDNTKWEELTVDEQAEFLYPKDGGKHSKEEWKGKPIFEGDIIKASFTVAGHENGCYAIGYIVYEEDGFKVRVTMSHNASKHAEYTSKNQSSYYIVHNFLERNYSIKIIGNRHDNPELLGGVE